MNAAQSLARIKELQQQLNSGQIDKSEFQELITDIQTQKVIEQNVADLECEEEIVKVLKDLIAVGSLASSFPI
jgi:hypothetical protein